MSTSKPKSKYLKMNQEETKENQENEENECMFCFCNVNIKEKHIKCMTCDKNFHYECYVDWKKQKNNKPMKCIHCSQFNLYKYYNKNNCLITRLFGANYIYQTFS